MLTNVDANPGGGGVNSGSPAHSPKPPVTRERLEGEANQVARRVAFGPAASSTLTPTEIRARLPSTRSGRATTGDSTAASIRRELGESLARFAEERRSLRG